VSRCTSAPNGQLDAIAHERHRRDACPALHLRRGQLARQRAHERRGAAHQAEALRLLREGAVTLCPLARHALEEHVAVARLRKGGEREFRDQVGHGRLHLRPEPGGPEIEAVGGRATGIVHRQDPPAEVITGLEQHEVDLRRVQEAGGLQAGEAGADDGDLGVHLWAVGRAESPALHLGSCASRVRRGGQSRRAGGNGS
jgi:hypothetical protein